MKPLTIALLLILACSLAAVAQQQQNVSIQTKIKAFKNSRRFTVKYDRFKDRTDITVGPFLIKDRQRSGIVETSVTLTFKGQDPPHAVENVYLWFRGYGLRLGDTSVYALLDGERFDLGEGDIISSGIVSGRASVLLVLPWSVFNKLADSKSAELQVGSVEIRLEEEHYQAFRDLISLLPAK